MIERRFGLVPIMYEWPQQPSDYVAMNELGLAFLQRMSPNSSIHTTGSNSKTLRDRQLEGTEGIWSLLDAENWIDEFESALPATAQGFYCHCMRLKHQAVCTEISLNYAVASAVGNAVDTAPFAAAAPHADNYPTSIVSPGMLARAVVPTFSILFFP